MAEGARPANGVGTNIRAIIGANCPRTTLTAEPDRDEPAQDPMAF
jgi:hypothetical protein